MGIESRIHLGMDPQEISSLADFPEISKVSKSPIGTPYGNVYEVVPWANGKDNKGYTLFTTQGPKGEEKVTSIIPFINRYH